jgi:hypothetical protein
MPARDGQPWKGGLNTAEKKKAITSLKSHVAGMADKYKDCHRRSLPSSDDGETIQVKRRV